MLQELIDEFDLDGNGEIDFDEFSKLMTLVVHNKVMTFDFSEQLRERR